MTISQEMFAAARGAIRPLGDLAPAAGEFFRGRQRGDGGFADRFGKSDLYYTVFAVLSLSALDEPFDIDRAAAYLRSHGTGRQLDLVHLGCLVRCWAHLPGAEPPETMRGELLDRLGEFRSADGGYALQPAQSAGSAYGCFLALGTFEDLGAQPDDPGAIVGCIRSLATDDGAYTNDRSLPVGSVPATAAAVTVLHHLGGGPPGESAAWMLAQQVPAGGFLAIPLAPQADLLSTATALHALSLLGADLAGVRPPCLRFVHSLRRADGGFAGHAEDPTSDCEYTCYALLSLGHLAG